MCGTDYVKQNNHNYDNYNKMSVHRYKYLIKQSSNDKCTLNLYYLHNVNIVDSSSYWVINNWKGIFEPYL